MVASKLKVVFKFLVKAFIFFLCFFLISEALLQLICKFSLKLNIILQGVSYPIKDKKLGLRGNPAHPEHDKNGFRNKSVPDSVTIVCLGDSQTYGGGAKRHEAWPQVLEKLSGLKTYNMAYGGYSPVHSTILLPEAFKFKPDLIIEAVYSGNDICDCYLATYINKISENFKTTSQTLRHKLSTLEQSSPLIKTIKSRNVFSKKQKIINFLAKYSKFYGLLRATKRLLLSSGNFVSSIMWNYYLKPKYRNRKDIYILETVSQKTLLTPLYRLTALNFSDIRIKEGFRILTETIKTLKLQTARKKIKFLVVIIPTKEFVYADFIKNKKNIPEAYKLLTKNESLFFRKLKSFLIKNKIDFINTTGELKKSISTSQQPYPITIDGHPNAIGYKIIANAIYKKVKCLFKDKKHYKSLN